MVGDPPSIMGLKARRTFANLQGTAYGGRPSHLIFRELRKGELRRIHLPGCEYPGGWLWATLRSGLTLLPRGPQGCLASDSSAGHLGVALRPPGTGAAS